MNRRLLALLGSGLLLAAVLPAPALAKAPARTFEADGKFIVQMVQDPVVAYMGGVKGLKATAPKQGQKIDPLSPAVTDYVAYLNGKHEKAISSVGGKKFYDYYFAFNGFAARMTAEQANKMAVQPGVVAVTKQRIQQLDTSSTPDFLGLTAKNGLWEQLGGPEMAGDGVIVGIVDSGIWPENPSFSDRIGWNGNGTKDGKLGMQQIPGWHGKCTPGEAFTASDCNQKLVGAQWFDEGYGGPAYIKSQFPAEFISARDADGHGSHTSSTAAGNYGVPVTVEGNDLGTISGMAPHARIATYKVCWGYGDEGGCANSDSVAAIDQAVADGVDVINFSISGSLTSFADPVEIAFLFAARAGIFVAASAGNSGPTASTVAHNSPWLTTVAAGTHDRQYLATATLGDGSSYTGAGLGAAVPTAPLIASTDAALAGIDPGDAALCVGAADGLVTLDPAKVKDKIVVCDRGVTARVNKSLAVKQAGGVGMILVNTAPSSLNADLHFVPTVHLPDTDRAAVLAYAAMPGATAEISAGVGGTGALAPDVAGFSSRGPARAGGGDLLKPDIMAPGNDILAAVSPNGYNGHDWDFLSGTSMSSPHIAGLAALMKQAHPTWSPAAIKSAFMTTASTIRNDGSAIPGNPFGYGAGQVVPNSATDPGLVYNAGWLDWLAFLCGNSSAVGAATCNSLAATYSFDASNLNYPSIAIGDLAGVQAVKRSVTNVSGSSETYTASVTAPAGIDVAVTPSTLSLDKGQTKSFTVTFTTESAPLNAYAFGSLTWEGSKGHMVTSPLVVKPVAMAAPASVTSNGTATSYKVTFGYTGPFTAAARGLVPAMTTASSVAQDPDQTFAPGDATGTTAIEVEIPADTAYARFETFDADVAPGSDLDLYVFFGGAQVGISAGGTSAEQVNLVNPAAGTYTVYVHGWGVPTGTTPFVLNSWAVTDAAAGNMTVSAPTTATTGTTGTISLTFSGLAAATKYLGQVAYSGVSGMPSPTIVSVTTP